MVFNPSSWQLKKLNEICNFQNGFAFKSKSFCDFGLPILRISNIQNNNLEINDVVYFNDKDYKEDFSKYRVIKGDLVIAMSGATTGKLGINNNDMVFYLNQRVGKFTPQKNLLSKEFLFHFLSTKIEENLKISAGSAQPNLSTEQIKNIKIPLPFISEQKRIVKILDEVFEEVGKAKGNAEKNLRNSRELFESYLQSVFEGKREGWEEKKLREVLQITETINPWNTPDKEYIYIDVSSVNKETLSIENTNLIKGKDAPSRARKLIKTNDVIFATVRPTLRRIAMISEDFDQQICSTGYFVLRAKDCLSNKLVFYFLQTNGFNEKMERLQRGTSYPAVTDGEVRDQIIIYPKSLSEQKAIVKKLDALSEETKKLEEIYKKEIADLEELKKSVLQKAFRGEL